jgi:hypothetical protein
MGGRSGQSLRGSAGSSSGTAGAAQAAPQGNATVTAKGFSGREALYAEFGQTYAREIGLNGNIGIQRVGSGDFQGGYVKSIYDPKTGRFEMQQTVFVKGGNMSKYQVEETVKHEMTHLKQFQDGRLDVKMNGGVLTKYWEGKPYISNREYSRIMNGFKSRSNAVRQRSYKAYRELPWEVEAHNAGDPFKNTP